MAHVGLTSLRWSGLCAVAGAVALGGCSRAPKVDSRADVELPALTKVAAEPPSAAHVIVTKTSIMVEGDPFPIAAIPRDPALGLAADDKRNGRDDVTITPLSQALRWKHDHEDAGEPSPEGPLLVVVADAHTTVRVAAEIVMTVGSDYRVAFAAKASDAKAPAGIVPLGAARLGRTSPSTRGRLEVRLGKEGVAIAFDERRVATGCQDVGPGPAVPRGAALDYAAVTACLAHIAKEVPDAFDRLGASAEPDTDLATYLKLLEAVRAAGVEDIEVLVPKASASR